MVIKRILLIGFVFSFLATQAQVLKPLPTEEEWQTYFYTRKKSIEKKLYQLAVLGSIKVYKTDSLESAYTLEDFKRRGVVTVGYEYDSSFFIIKSPEGNMLVRRSNKEIDNRRKERIKLKGGGKPKIYSI